MSELRDKILQAKADLDAVYEAGKKDGIGESEIYFKEIADIVNAKGNEYISPTTPYSEYDDKIKERLSSEYSNGIILGKDMYANENVHPHLARLRERMRGNLAPTGDFTDLNVDSHVDVVIADFDKTEAAIEAHGVTVPDNDTASFAECIDAVYEAGKQAGGGDFLLFASSVKFTDLNLFEKAEVELNIPLAKDYSSMMADKVSNTTVEHLTINGSLGGTITNATSAFGTSNAYKDTTLKRITFNCDFSKCKLFSVMLAYRNALEIIDGEPINFSSATTIGNFNTGNYSLKEIRVVPLTIKVPISFATTSNLTNETIQSIVEGLADMTGSTTQTVTFATAVVSRLTSSQLETIQNKNWQVA